MNLVGFRTHTFRAGYFSKRFPALVERALEIFRHSYFPASARDYDERRADTTIKAIRSEEVNRSRRRKISARGSKDGKLLFIPAWQQKIPLSSGI